MTVTTHSCVTVRFIRTRAPCPAPVLNTGPQDCLALSAGPAEPDAEIPASGKEQRSKRLSFAPSLLFPSFLGVLPPAGPLPAPITRPGVCAPPPQTPVIADGVALRSCEEAQELEQPPDRPPGGAARERPVKGRLCAGWLLGSCIQLPRAEGPARVESGIGSPHSPRPAPHPLSSAFFSSHPAPTQKRNRCSRRRRRESSRWCRDPPPSAGVGGGRERPDATPAAPAGWLHWLPALSSLPLSPASGMLPHRVSGTQ